jgi:hypothetical protein
MSNLLPVNMKLSKLFNSIMKILLLSLRQLLAIFFNNIIILESQRRFYSFFFLFLLILLFTMLFYDNFLIGWMLNLFQILGCLLKKWIIICSFVCYLGHFRILNKRLRLFIFSWVNRLYIRIFNFPKIYWMHSLFCQNFINIFKRYFLKMRAISRFILYIILILIGHQWRLVFIIIAFFYLTGLLMHILLLFITLTIYNYRINIRRLVLYLFIQIFILYIC